MAVTKPRLELVKSKAIDTMRERVLFVMPAIGNDAAVATAAIVASRTTFRAGRRAARGEIVQQGDRGSEVADGNRQLILVVEDDPELRDEILRPGLHEAGFDTIGAGSAIEAYRSMLSQDYSMLILDIGLPDEDGFTLARNLREVTDAGIIMLTGRSYSNVERARALNESADAYLTKPVDIDVLSATVRSILRRQHGQPATESRRPPPGWHLDMNGWNLVTSGGHNIRLTHAERALLELLFANPNEAVPRATIIARLCRDIHDFDPHRLEMLVHRLRRKTLAESGDSLPLSAVRGVGYVLTPS